MSNSNYTEKPLLLSLQQLPKQLRLVGYSEMCWPLGCTSLTPHRWSALVAEQSEPLNSLGRLLLLNEQVSIGALTESLGDTVSVLMRLGLLVRSGTDTVRTAGLILLPVQSLWMWFECPLERTYFYLGDESLALGTRMFIPPRSTVLDLGTGAGYLAVRAAENASRVVATDINVVASGLAALNAAMNGHSSNIEIRVGDLYSSVGNERFDVIVSNPPFLPVPEGYEFPLTCNGGPDGLGTLRRVLRDLPRHLALSGSAQLLGVSFGSGTHIQFEDELATWSAGNGFDSTLAILWSSALTDTYGWAAKAAKLISAVNQRDDSAEPDEILISFQATGATHIHGFAIHTAPGQGRIQTIRATPISTNIWNPDTALRIQ